MDCISLAPFLSTSRGHQHITDTSFPSTNSGAHGSSHSSSSASGKVSKLSSPPCFLAVPPSSSHFFLCSEETMAPPASQKGSPDFPFILPEEANTISRYEERVSFSGYLDLLRSCGNTEDLSSGRIVHDHICRSHLWEHRILRSMVVEMYGKCGAVEDARCVFESIRVKTVYSWNIMISVYTQNECFELALVLFREMVLSEGFEPDKFTLSSALAACVDINLLHEGCLIHSKVVNLGLESDIVIGTALLNMYSKCGSLDEAFRMFNRIQKHDIIAWNAMIAACVYCHDNKRALDVFEKVMHREDVKPNHSTYVSILRACASIGTNDNFSWIHVDIILSGVDMDVVIGTALVSMYSRCGNLELAESVFNRMPQRDLVTWNTLLSAYLYYWRSFDTLKFLHQMKLKKIDPDDYTFSAAIDGCSDLQKGRSIHANIIDAGFEQYSIVGNALITMYSKCGSLDDAEISFCRMSNHRAIISWNAMISAYQEHGQSNKAIQLYFQMVDDDEVAPNNITFISVLGACGNIASLDDGKLVHKTLTENGFESDTIIARAVVHMYGKCGDLDNSSKVFSKISDKNVVCWNIIINAYAQHGMGEEALQRFTQMQRDGVQPDAITFVSVLQACSHAGLVNQAKFYFASMTRDYGISPSGEHFVSMIDLFGRFGHLDEAEALLKDVRVSNEVVAWKAFLGACRTHGADKERAKYAAEHIMKLEPTLSAPYVLLSDTSE